MAISRLSDDVDVIRSGVATALAVAGMPVAPGAGWGVAVGTGHFDGESAFSAGVTYRAEKVNFKFAVASSSGETSVSAGMAYSF